ncbi:GNAT domain-containing protein [Umbelopsis sp. AD052]|nr:GNAT domain-containing protein [Umbelopsis sp. AD052]
MRQNENLVLIGPKAILVPYKPEHVLVYHEWMKSPFLQEMTASEPLTLQEEYDMQQSWHLDDNKCTFIILALPPPGTISEELNTTALSKAGTVMIGDVNLFFNDPDNDKSCAEIEIMIAEETYRRSGYGIEAIKMMMAYAMTELGVKKFEAKISLKNQPSIDMFCSKLGFRERSVSTIFEEVTLDWQTSSAQKIDGEEDLPEPTKEELEAMQRVENQILAFWEDNVRSTTWEKA